MAMTGKTVRNLGCDSIELWHLYEQDSGHAHNASHNIIDMMSALRAFLSSIFLLLRQMVHGIDERSQEINRRIANTVDTKETLLAYCSNACPSVHRSSKKESGLLPEQHRWSTNEAPLQPFIFCLVSVSALKFCFKTCVAMKFVDDDNDDDDPCLQALCWWKNIKKILI